MSDPIVALVIIAAFAVIMVGLMADFDEMYREAQEQALLEEEA